MLIQKDIGTVHFETNGNKTSIMSVFPFLLRRAFIDKIIEVYNIRAHPSMKF